MILAIDIAEGRGLSNYTHCELISKEGQAYAVFAVHFTVKAILPAVFY